jgi:hypothetical protein
MGSIIGFIDQGHPFCIRSRPGDPLHLNVIGYSQYPEEGRHCFLFTLASVSIDDPGLRSTSSSLHSSFYLTALPPSPSELCRPPCSPSSSIRPAHLVSSERQLFLLCDIVAVIHSLSRSQFPKASVISFRFFPSA